MAERGVGAVVVLEGEAIAAILTERDVMKAVAAGKDGSAPVSDWMTQSSRHDRAERHDGSRRLAR